MPLTLLVGTVALTIAGNAVSGTADSVRAALPRTAVMPAPAAAFAADSIVVEKSEHRLSLYRNGTLVRQYLVALGAQPVGDKVRLGDNRTPEGVFRIEARNPQSRYHRALRISYPDAAHRARAQALGVSPGGDIMIHGLPKRQAWVGAAHRDFDWTEGCIAVTNAEIEEIWSAVPVGTPIHIKP
jgi:murein L,D-transpeptidase YafK